MKTYHSIIKVANYLHSNAFEWMEKKKQKILLNQFDIWQTGVCLGYRMKF